MKRIQARQDVCIACRLCEIHCAVRHTETGDLIRAWRRRETRPTPRIRVEERRPFSIAVPCHHCAEPPCVYACISGAMQRASDGTVRVDPDRCVGCWTCILACPYGAVVGEIGGRKVVKCDLCSGDAVPACVAHCPNGALSLVETANEPVGLGGVAG